MINFEDLLKGGDLRSIGRSNKVVNLIDSQDNFDQLFQLLFHTDRKVVMRAADAIEKVTFSNSIYLLKHKKAILQLCHSAESKELKWHLALIVSRIKLSKPQLGQIWNLLSNWTMNKIESRIVRVNALQGMFNLLDQDRNLIKDFILTLNQLEKENIPSLMARVRKLRKDGMKNKS